MRVYPREMVFIRKVLQPVSRCAGAHKISGVVRREEYSPRKMVPLGAELFRSFIVVRPIFFQHIHCFIVHVKPAVARIGLAAFFDSGACAVGDEVLADMYTVFIKVNVIP